MAGISATGIGSGLDVEGIVNTLMALERRPLVALKKQETEANAQLSAFGTLKSALADFQTAMDNLSTVAKFQVFSTTSSDASVFTATAASNAAVGSYAIQFDTSASPTPHQLATANKISSASFSDTTTSIGASGTLELSLGASSFQINVDGSNDTLEGLRDSINNATDNPGITATLVNLDSGSKLILSSDKTGSANAITLSDISGNVNTTLSTVEISPAQDAIFSIDGDANVVTSATNTVVDAIEGVTINLLAPSTSDVTQTLSISRDNDSVVTSVQAFVDAYNQIRTKISDLRAGSLEGDNTLLNIERQIRNVLNTKPSGITSSFSYLAEVGITTLESGDLSLDTTELKTALTTDYSGVAQLFANDSQGYVFRLSSVAKSFADFDGLVESREDGINSRITLLQDRQSNMEYRLELIEKRFRSQFAALDGLIAQLNSTSNFLNTQLASISSIGASRK